MASGSNFTISFPVGGATYQQDASYAVAPQGGTSLTATVGVYANDGLHVPSGLICYIYDTIDLTTPVATSGSATANTQSISFTAVSGRSYLVGGQYGFVSSGAAEMDLQMSSYTPASGGGGGTGVTVGVRRSGTFSNASAVKVFRSSVWVTATNVKCFRSGAWVTVR